MNRIHLEKIRNAIFSQNKSGAIYVWYKRTNCFIGTMVKIIRVFKGGQVCAFNKFS